jgi:iodotyrosine deiodinase
MQSKIITQNGHNYISYQKPMLTAGQVHFQSQQFYNELNTRRSIRQFSNQPVPQLVIENIIKTASTAPSGAHRQPWTFCAISNKAIKNQIRIAAEAEEKINYESRMSERWKKDLAHLGTDMHKPFLDDAPWLIAVFKQLHGYDNQGEKLQHYYVNESVGIACGILITAIHKAGLATLTHTPSPMNFLEKILNRPDNERAFLLLPVGYPAQPIIVPQLQRKTLEQMAVFIN